MKSLSGKIRLAYTSLALIVLMLCGSAVFDLSFLEKQANEGVAISSLFNAIQEMRRYEKNLFLYADHNALLETDQFAEVAYHILDTQREAIAEVTTDAELAKLKQNLFEYRGLLSSLHNSNDITEAFEHIIREKGQTISMLASSFSELERKLLVDAIRWSRSWLLITIFVIGILVYIVGRLLARAVVLPLRQLEANLMPIAQGKFDHLETESRDSEFIAFADAFNRMLIELDIRQRRLLQSEKLASLGTLAAGVAHEINNPLSNISSSCQLLKEEIDSAEPQLLRTWLQQIDDETERARQIVRALLEYGHQRGLNLQPVPLASILEKTRILVNSTVRKQQASLEIEMANKPILFADSQRMQQVFINLIRNALNAGDHNTIIRISVSACSKPSPFPADAIVVGNQRLLDQDNYVDISVEDNGPGIPAEIIHHIFDPFFTTQEPGHGVGLGLYIIHEIIREHDGVIAVSSSPEKGSKFTIRLACQESNS